MGKKNNTQMDDMIFHNTELLLRNYRDVVWSLEVSVFHANTSFLEEYGSSLEDFLEMSYVDGMDVDASDVAARIKSINRSRNMLRIIDSAVELLRKKHRKGEIYYWTLYYSYLSPQELENVEEIVDKLSNYTKDMSRRTYFRKRDEAVLQLGRLLWGYTTKECMEILERFVPE